MIDLRGRKTQWLRGVLDLVVLALLRDNGPTHGYALVHALASCGVDGVKGGTLYPLLSRLSDDGFVSGVWEPSEVGPARKYFAITSAGEELLDGAAPAWAEFVDVIGVVLGDAVTLRSAPQGHGRVEPPARRKEPK